jgi:hypothetical protein
LGQERIGNSPTPTAAPTVTTPSPTPATIPAVGPQPTEPPSAAASRLPAAMQAAVLKVAPGGELLGFVSSGSDVPFKLAPYGGDVPPDLPYRGAAHLLLDDRVGHPTIRIVVGVIGSDERPTCAGQPDCVESTGPNGERIVAVTETITKTSDSSIAQVIEDVPGVWHKVWVEHRAGDFVMVEHHNFPEGGEPPFQVPILSRDELLQIALDPALTLYP